MAVMYSLRAYKRSPTNEVAHALVSAPAHTAGRVWGAHIQGALRPPGQRALGQKHMTARLMG